MKKKYHVVLTPNEPEIIAFKKSLPQGTFSKSVATIMTESLKDKVAKIPMNFKIEPVIEDVHTKISLPEELVEKFCKKFGCQKGNLDGLDFDEGRRFGQGWPERRDIHDRQWRKGRHGADRTRHYRRCGRSGRDGQGFDVR